MEASEASELIRDAVMGSGERWADLGAGSGTFTRALVSLLGRGARIDSVDRDARAIAEIRNWAKAEAPGVVAHVADISGPLELPEFDAGGFDGVLLANVLHYVRDAEAALGRFVGLLKPGGRIVLIEYDRRRASPWVPYPIPPARWSAMAAQAGLSEPLITARRPSDFGGTLYVARAERPARGITPLPAVSPLPSLPPRKC